MTSATTPPREVRIGDRHVQIEEPNGFKFLEATEILGIISEQVPDITTKYEAFVRETRERGAERLTRPEALARYPAAFADVDDAWWQERGGVFTIPGTPPSDWQTGVFLFNHVFRVARDPVIRLVALLAAPAAELEQAEMGEGGATLDAYLKDEGRRLLHKGKITDLVLILLESLRAMRTEFEADAEAAQALGEVQAFFGWGRQTQTTPSQETSSQDTPTQSESSPPQSDDSPAPAPQASPAPENAPPASAETPSKPDSSTSSEPPTGGTDATPSTAPGGPSSDSSASSSPPTAEPAAAT